jgi:prepilin-type N-terminal cleavage/methylation domain-containing protein/prepilin-type processing-associated H-X9-DG protein
MGSRREGFTLVEVIVTVAVIGILAAILLPVFASARERGRQSRCATNLRQIGAAFDLYTEDWDGTFPPLYYLRNDGGRLQEVTWKAQLFPYIGINGLYLCPSSQWWGDRYYAEHPEVPPPSYAANQMALSHREKDYGGDAPFLLSRSTERSVGDIRNPSETVLVFETQLPNNDYLWWPRGSSPFAPIGRGHGLFRLHGTQSNFLMVDGRVKALPVIQTLTQGMWGTPDMLTRDWPSSPVPPHHPWIASAAPEYR